jgi:hypothetical protein
MQGNRQRGPYQTQAAADLQVLNLMWRPASGGRHVFRTSAALCHTERPRDLPSRNNCFNSLSGSFTLVGITRIVLRVLMPFRAQYSRQRRGDSGDSFYCMMLAVRQFAIMNRNFQSSQLHHFGNDQRCGSLFMRILSSKGVACWDANDALLSAASVNICRRGQQLTCSILTKRVRLGLWVAMLANLARSWFLIRSRPGN